MEPQCVIQMENYIVNRIDFHLNPDFDFKIMKKHLEINPRFERQIKELDENSLAVEISLSIHDNDVPSPFHLDVVISGLFHCALWKKSSEEGKIVVDRITAILFPYLRSLVSTVTVNANIPPVVIPVMNVSALFDQKEEK